MSHPTFRIIAETPPLVRTCFAARELTLDRWIRTDFDGRVKNKVYWNSSIDKLLFRSVWDFSCFAINGLIPLDGPPPPSSFNQIRFIGFHGIERDFSNNNTAAEITEICLGQALAVFGNLREVAIEMVENPVDGSEEAYNRSKLRIRRQWLAAKWENHRLQTRNGSRTQFEMSVVMPKLSYLSPKEFAEGWKR